MDVMVPVASDGPTPAAPAAPVLGAVTSFERFCAEHHSRLAALGYVLTGSWSTGEDLAQDALFAAFRRWDDLVHYDDPGAWARRVVANRAVSWRRRLTSEASALVRLGGRRAPVAPAPDVPTDCAESWAAVRRLPTRQAQVFALTYVDDLSLDGVAAVLGISPGTAKTHLTRARAALAAEVGPQRSDPCANGMGDGDEETRR